MGLASKESQGQSLFTPGGTEVAEEKTIICFMYGIIDFLFQFQYLINEKPTQKPL